MTQPGITEGMFSHVLFCDKSNQLYPTRLKELASFLVMTCLNGFAPACGSPRGWA